MTEYKVEVIIDGDAYLTVVADDEGEAVALVEKMTIKDVLRLADETNINVEVTEIWSTDGGDID